VVDSNEVGFAKKKGSLCLRICCGGKYSKGASDPRR